METWHRAGLLSSLFYYSTCMILAFLLNNKCVVLALTKTSTGRRVSNRHCRRPALSKIMAASSASASSSSNNIKSSSSSGEKSLVVEPFCYRQFAENEESKSYLGTVFQLVGTLVCLLCRRSIRKVATTSFWTAYCVLQAQVTRRRT
jgi:hypothetical protein